MKVYEASLSVPIFLKIQFNEMSKFFSDAQLLQNGNQHKKSPSILSMKMFEIKNRPTVSLLIQKKTFFLEFNFVTFNLVKLNTFYGTI